MNIQPLINPIVSFSNQFYEFTKDGVCWSLQIVKEGYSRYATPTTLKVKEIANLAFGLLQKLINARPGMIFALAGSLLLAGIAAFKLADRKAYDEDTLIKTAWKTVGVAAFISSTALTSIGIFAILSV